MPTVLITGANRGLGLEFVKQYAAAGWRVLAGCREPLEAEQLRSIQAQNSLIEIFALNVTDFDQIDTLAKQLAGVAIDVLINNAGVYGDKSAFGQLDYQAWSNTLAVNTLAPVKMTEAFLPHVQQGKNKIVAVVSSQMGSIADNSSGGSLFYRSSKAGVNAAMKTLAYDLARYSIGVLIFHPGWVKTDMGGINALIEADESVAGMRQIIEHFQLKQSGQFFKYNGEIIPW